MRQTLQLLLSWKTRIYSIQCLPGNNRSNKRNTIRKTLPRGNVRIFKIETLFDLIPNLNRVRETRHSNNIPAIHARHNYFKNSFFPSTISEWNNRDCKIRNLGSLSIFNKNLLNFIRPCVNSIFNIHNPYGIKLLTRLRLGLSHLRDHIFRHCFQCTLNPLCDCDNDTETTIHFFSSAQISILLDKPSWTILETSTNRFYLTAKIS